MRSILGTCFVAAALAAPPAFAQAPQLNHLDCRFDESVQDIVCPDVPAGRASAGSIAPVAAQPAPAKPGEPAPGTPEWNAACAAKYKSFDASTGMYTSYSGQIRPCK